MSGCWVFLFFSRFRLGAEKVLVKTRLFTLTVERLQLWRWRLLLSPGWERGPLIGHVGALCEVGQRRAVISEGGAEPELPVAHSGCRLRGLGSDSDPEWKFGGVPWAELSKTNLYVKGSEWPTVASPVRQPSFRFSLSLAEPSSTTSGLRSLVFYALRELE